jgi:hypothetical protein
VSENIINLVQHAGFIFAGTVQQSHASTLQRLSSDRTAIVRVASVIEAVPPLSSWVGRDITIEFRETEHPDNGQTAIFFATGWVYGDSLAVREVGHSLVTDNLTHARQQIVEARRRLVDEDLRERLGAATMVIAGAVRQIGRDPKLREGAGEREHDPHWLTAIVGIERVLRGTPDAKSVAVLFAGSRHIAWRETPTLQLGQRGVWILGIPRMDERGREAFMVRDYRDVRSPEEMPRIEAVLNEMA